MDLKQYLKDLEYLVNIDSGKDNPEGIVKCMEFFKDAFNSLNWTTELIEVGAVAPCFVAYNRKASHYDAFLTGHLDTVFKKGTTSERPYTVKDNIAYGPGVCDMKSGCLNILYAIRELSEEEKKKNLVVFFQPDEEIGSPKSRFEMKKLVSISSKCLSLESATDEDGVPVYVIQRKGILQYGYELIGKAGHAGNLLYNGAISAINEMAYWITKISSLVNKETETTANVGIVKGGTATNVVPQNASLEGEVRFWTTEEAQKARALFEELENHAKEAGIETNHYFTRYEDPWTPTPESISLAAKYNLATKKRGGLSSCNFLNSLTPVCIDGLGPSGGLAHSVDEYLCLNNIEDSVSLLLKLIFS